MPTGPEGQKRPPDTVGCAVTVGRIAIGELEETPAPPRKGRQARGKAQREEIAHEDSARQT